MMGGGAFRRFPALFCPIGFDTHFAAAARAPRLP